MSTPDLPRPPVGTRAAGRRLWLAVVAEFELAEHELVLLREAVRLTDRLDVLDRTLRRDGLTVEGSKGQPRTHPALTEARGCQLVLARVLAALRMPAGDEEAARPQRRTIRGVYGVGGGPARIRVVR